MQMPVVVGVILSIIFLVSFSGWFYHLASGVEQFVLDDYYFWYRIGAVSIFSMLIMTMTFFGLAYANECPEISKGKTTPLADKLNCPAFYKIKTSTEDIFKKQEPAIKEAPKNDLESQTIEI